MNILKINNWADNPPQNYTGVVEYSMNIKEWYLNGELHRVDGPAIDYPLAGYQRWFLNGIEYSQEEWFEQLSEEDKLNAIWNLR
jgi:hypothetical protein